MAPNKDRVYIALYVRAGVYICIYSIFFFLLFFFVVCLCYFSTFIIN